MTKKEDVEKLDRNRRFRDDKPIGSEEVQQRVGWAEGSQNGKSLNRRLTMFPFMGFYVFTTGTNVTS